MVYHELLNCDLKQVILDTVYCAYHAVTPANRPETLYGVIANAKKDEITLEAIMQHGDEELPDLEDFLPPWVRFGNPWERWAQNRDLLVSGEVAEGNANNIVYRISLSLPED